MWSHNKGVVGEKNFTFTRCKFLLVTVKEWLKSVPNYRSYPKIKLGMFFWTTLYIEKLTKMMIGKLVAVSQDHDSSNRMATTSLLFT